MAVQQDVLRMPDDPQRDVVGVFDPTIEFRYNEDTCRYIRYKNGMRSDGYPSFSWEELMTRTEGVTVKPRVFREGDVIETEDDLVELGETHPGSFVHTGNTADRFPAMVDEEGVILGYPSDGQEAFRYSFSDLLYMVLGEAPLRIVVLAD